MSVLNHPPSVDYCVAVLGRVLTPVKVSEVA